MNENRETPETRESIARELDLERSHASGARWFYWIAALSLVNSVSTLTGNEFGFVIGLSITQFIDSFAVILTKNAGEMAAAGKLIAFVLDVLVSGLFVLFGVFAHKGFKWAFILGMVCYAADGLLYILLGSWLAIAFHVLALYCMWRGLQSHEKLAAIRASAAADSST